MASFDKPFPKAKVRKVSYFGDHLFVKLISRDGTRISLKFPPQLPLKQGADLSFLLDHYTVES
jgi:hypothetical protein